MLSDEEKALKVVNKRTERLIEELKIEEEDLIDEPKIAYLITQIEANKTLVNLIEKQQKEIEELKENNGYHLGFIDGGIAKKYEYQDKIKAKIEEVDENGYWEFLEKRDEEKCKDILQSLLEKE